MLAAGLLRHGVPDAVRHVVDRGRPGERLGARVAPRYATLCRRAGGRSRTARLAGGLTAPARGLRDMKRPPTCLPVASPLAQRAGPLPALMPAVPGAGVAV